MIKNKFLINAFIFLNLLLTPVFADTKIDLPDGGKSHFDAMMRNMDKDRFEKAFGQFLQYAGSFLNFLIIIGLMICVLALIYTAVLFSTTDNVAEHMRAKKNLAVVLACTAGIGGFRIILQLILFVMSM